MRLGKKFWAHDGRRVDCEGRAGGSGARVRAALEAFLRRLKGLTGSERMDEGWLAFV